MFVGSVPKVVVSQILDVVDFKDWGSVFVCCSGSFRVDRTIKAKYPTCKIISNDVSLYSVAIGRLMTGEPFPIIFTERLAFVEKLVGADFLDRVAAVLVAHELAAYKGDNAWAHAHFNHYVTSFASYHEQARSRLEAMLAGPKVDQFIAGDFRQMAVLAKKAKGGVVAFPPTYKGGYEQLFKFVDGNTEWKRPAYDVWDPIGLEAWVEELKTAAVPYCVFSDHLFEGKSNKPVTSYSTDGRKTVYTYANTKAASVRQTQHRSTPFRYEPVDPWELTPNTKVHIVEATSQQLNFLKDLYLAKSIAHVSGEASHLVYLDGKLAGAFIYQRSKFGKQGSIYLLSDFAIVTERKLSKLICLLATSTVTVSAFERKTLTKLHSLSTTAFTKRPVSMKYRGVFDVYNRKPGMINYVSLVRHGTPQELYKLWYSKWAKKQNRPAPVARSETAEV